MAAQSIALPPGFDAALRIITARLADCPADWVITGSVGMVLQGLPLRPGDIDLQSDGQGVVALQERLAEYITQPVYFKSGARIQSHFGRLEIEGVQVELMGDMQFRAPGEDWTAPGDVLEHRIFWSYSGMRLPLLDLHYEAEAYRRMGRLEKAAMIEAWLREHDG